MSSGTQWVIFVFFGAVVFLVAFLLTLSYFLGQRHRERDTDKPYESGMEPTGNARVRYDFKFYLVAVLFVIFDIETAFIFAWAIAVRELGWGGYVEILILIVILSALLVYILRVGALDWQRKRGTGRDERRGLPTDESGSTE
jgi:NADH-quinone oxidoreductase subunit A